MASVFNVADYIVTKLGNLTTMKLQKLVYYCQAWSLAWDDQPLFEDDFEAWSNGPVCRSLFEIHKGKYVVHNDSFKKYVNEETFTKTQTETIDAVLNDLGDKEPLWLSELTHSETPWKNARKGYAETEPCSKVISKDSMQAY
ncbi:MAG: DUF4065 domain-containing protein, partial [Oscillospiraceae bacterium]